MFHVLSIDWAACDTSSSLSPLPRIPRPEVLGMSWDPGGTSLCLRLKFSSLWFMSSKHQQALSNPPRTPYSSLVKPQESRPGRISRLFFPCPCYFLIFCCWGGLNLFPFSLDWFIPHWSNLKNRALVKSQDSSSRALAISSLLFFFLGGGLTYIPFFLGLVYSSLVEPQESCLGQISRLFFPCPYTSTPFLLPGGSILRGGLVSPR